MNEKTNIVKINLKEILPNRFQPRIKFEDTSINELSTSIKEHGVIQPILVRRISDKYEIIAGERRYKASVLAGMETIPAIITDFNDKESAEIALIENVQRQDLSAIEKAISYRRILDMGDLTQNDLANKVGKSQASIANSLRLLNLPEEVQEDILHNKISERHGRSLLKLINKKDQLLMLEKIKNERIPVRKLDDEIEKVLKQTNTLPSLEFSSSTKIIELKKETFDEINIEELNIPSTPIINDVIKENIPIVPIVELAPQYNQYSSQGAEETKVNERLVQPDVSNEATDQQAAIKPAGRFFNFEEIESPQIIQKEEPEISLLTEYGVLSTFDPKELTAVPQNTEAGNIQTIDLELTEKGKSSNIVVIKKLREIVERFEDEGIKIDIEELDMGSEYRINLTIKDE